MRAGERSPQEPSGQGLAGGSRAAPGIRHLPGDGDSPRPGQGTSPWTALAQGSLMGQRSWRSASYSITGAGTEGPRWGLKWGPGPQAGLGGWKGTIQPLSALSALTKKSDILAGFFGWLVSWLFGGGV